jgi:hypothetical protein
MTWAMIKNRKKPIPEDTIDLEIINAEIEEEE